MAADRFAVSSGVRLGAITYSFRAITDAKAIVKAMASMGLGEAELMSNHAEALAGAPGGRGGSRRRSTRGDGQRRQKPGARAQRVRGRRHPASDSFVTT